LGQTQVSWIEQPHLVQGSWVRRQDPRLMGTGLNPRLLSLALRLASGHKALGCASGPKAPRFNRFAGPKALGFGLGI